MPSELPPTVRLVGSPQYRAFLDRLRDRLAGEGLDVHTHSDVAEVAIERLAESYGLPVPPRKLPVGGQRPGAGRPRGGK